MAALEPELARAADDGLRARAEALRRRARAPVAPDQPAPGGERSDDLLDALLPEAFALVREGARRRLGQRPFDTQIAGGIALHEGKAAEMPTGEGKTLAAVAPVFLHALAGRGAHVLTFNDYLARRDARWMGPVYELLGLEAASVQEGMTPAERQRAYAADVTYLTAKEAGFDLLRDGLCLDTAGQVHRPFHFALVDEADSVLVDEARIPLVIAGALEQDRAGLPRLAALARELRVGIDFETDEARRNLFLTGEGVGEAERALARADLMTEENAALLAALRNALHAEHLLRRDVDYIVRRGAVELVDELTGRVAENRHWPDGLQAAVEAKEGLRLGADGRILGSITLQHFLRLYPHLCGMTATARSAEGELREVYGLEVAVIPPHRPCIRRDLPDLLYTQRAARDRALAEEIVRVHGTGRPILVGTESVAASERLAADLARRDIPCRVLNAKNDEEEAAIVAEAGALGAVTLSTNMAGRGTDIRLGGGSAPDRERDRERVVALGGLYVIGTHRHESVRIDDQLRGRAGRQGDPGSSRFFVCLDDDLLERSGIASLIPAKLFPEESDAPIDSPVVRREVARAQRILEGQCSDARRRLYEFSEILERQREYVAAWRQAVLEGSDPAGDEGGGSLLAGRAAGRWRRLEGELGADRLREVERRLTLLAVDRCWSDHLTEMQAVRDEVHLVALDGRLPIAEFYRTAIAGFESLLARIDDEVVRSFGELELGPDGPDWDEGALRGPAATWTYMVHDDVFAGNVFLGLANRASIGFMAVLVLWPVLFAWGLYLRWKRRKDGGAGR